MAYYLVTAMLGLIIFTGSYASDYDRTKLVLPEIFSDHMVIQRDQPICIWGKAGPLERIEVRLNGAVARGSADLSGHWSITLAAMPAGGPYELVVQGTLTIVVRDILIGDVWLCAGQSNMVWPVAESDFTPADIQYANFSKLRHFVRKAPTLTSTICPEVWREADAQNVTDFSAVAYSFSSELQAKSNVPIGIIECAVSGSPIKAWISKSSIKKKGRIPGLTFWTYSRFYDDMVVPLCRNHIKGVVWYQGESDIFGASEYPKLLRLLIKDWRSAFGEPAMPFLFVQLPNCGRRSSTPSDSLWADLREAQQKCASAPHVYMTVNIDTAHNGAAGADLHPQTKIEVGHRLAQLALTTCYGAKGIHISPIYESLSREGNSIRIHVRRVENGLFCHGESVKGFAIAADDQRFCWANAQISPDGNDVKVWSEKVLHPVAVRYAWADNPECNLYSFEGLPVTPFRTDNWRSSLVPPKR
jgi:sialate O-acetylesterase